MLQQCQRLQAVLKHEAKRTGTSKAEQKKQRRRVVKVIFAAAALPAR